MLARSYRSIVLPPESLIKTIIALGLSVVNEKIDSFVIWPFCSKFKRVHKKELFKHWLLDYLLRSGDTVGTRHRRLLLVFLAGLQRQDWHTS